MTFRMVALSILAASVALVSAAAQAATVTPTGGTVSVNRGSGYVRVNGPTEVNAGDLVLVQGGEAQVSFPNGCTVNVAAGGVFTVGPEAPCTAGADGSFTNYAIAGGVVAAVGGGIAIIASQSDSKKSSP